MFSRCLLMESCVDDVSDTQGSVPEGIEFSLHEEAVSELSVPSVGVVLPQRSLEDMLKSAKSIITACVHLQDRIQPRFYQHCTALSCGMFTGRAQQHQVLFDDLCDLLMHEDFSIADKLRAFNLWWSFQVKVPINSIESKSLFNWQCRWFSTDYFLEQVHQGCTDIVEQAGISDVTTLLENNELQNYYFTPSIAVNPMRVSQSNSPT